MSSKISPNRRRSISVLSQGTSGRGAQQNRRRAYSIAPGEKLSPAAKARRLMMPRKSILKASVNIPPEPSPEAIADTSDATQAMELTEVVHNARSRRVSFAEHAFVRLFTKDNKNAQDSEPPSSSPERPSVRFVNDENTHPDNAARSRRRSSRRRSSTTFSEYGEQSMDMDEDDMAPDPSQFRDGEQYYEDDFSEDEVSREEGDDMDLTEAVEQRIIRKRSLSLGGDSGPLALRRRSSIAPMTTSSQQQSENPSLTDNAVQYGDPLEQEQDDTTSSALSQSFVSEGSSGEHTAPMEFTVPMGQTLRAPATEDPVWLQLRAATHAGGNPPSSDDLAHDEVDDDGDEPMELTVAMTRLMEARKSLGLPPPIGPLVTPQSGDADQDGESFRDDDTFTSTEDGSFRDLDELGDRTLNITQTINRSSLASQDMDVTDVLHREIELLSPPPLSVGASTADTEVPNSPAAIPSSRVAPFDIRPRVFSAPPSRTNANPQSPSKSLVTSTSTNDRPFTFTLPPKLGTSSDPPRSPSKIPVFRGTAAFAPPTIPKSPKKRPAPEEPGADRPSPAKKQAITRPSPSKSAPQPSETSAAANKRTGAVRRPSGYFAQRKSLGAAVMTSTLSAGVNTQAQSAQRPNGARASLGSTAAKQIALYPDLASLQKDINSVPARTIMSQPFDEVVTSSVSAASSTTTVSANIEEAPVSTTRQEDGSNAFALQPQAPFHTIIERPVSLTERHDTMEEVPKMGSDFDFDPLRSTEVQHLDSPEAQEEGQDDGKFTQRWRDDVQADLNPEDNGPPISIEQFFKMTGVGFMEDITAPRRSSIHPSQLQSRSRRRRLSSSQNGQDSDLALSQTDTADAVPLAEFMTSMAIDIPQLELYSTIANQLSGWIEDSRKICREADEEALQVTPGVFRDFADADDADRELLKHQLKIIKANMYGTAKSQWYNWKKDWTEQLRSTAEATFDALESDAKMLENINAQAQAMLPALQFEYELVMKELEEEQADIARVESDDQEFLAELKATIAEQDSELQSYRADVSEAKAKLARLEEKQAEFDSQRQEASAAISQAEHVIHVQKESTSAEVFRLKDELEALQDLHLWRCTKLTSDTMELNYASKYEVIVPCRQFQPIPIRAEVRRSKVSQLKERDPFPTLSQLMLAGAQTLLQRLSQDVTPQQIVQLLGNFWSACTQFKSQLTFLAIKYPTSVETEPASGDSPTLVARATILFPSVKSKARISFVLDAHTYTTWPMSVQSLRTEVDVVYGQIDREVILNAVSGRLAQANTSDNHGCLLDACIEAAEQYA